MKGGSIASDAVTGLVDKATFEQMNVRFDNKVGGCGCGKIGGKCAIHRQQKKQGGNFLKQIFGNSTANAFKGGNGSCGAKQTGGQMPSISQLMASNSSLDFSVKNRQTGGKPTSVAAKKPATASKKKTPKKRTMKGGADATGATILNDVGPKVNLERVNWTPKTAPAATSTEIFATEGIHTLPLLQKTTTFGQVSSSFDSPFNFGSSLGLPMKPIVGSVVSGASLPAESQAGGKKVVVKRKPAAKKVATKPKPKPAAKKRTTKKH